MRILLALLLAFLFDAALAEKADKDKPTQIEANRMQSDETRRMNIFEGNVVVTKGTLTVRGNAIEMEVSATTIGRTASAKEVTALSRSLRLDGDVLTYKVRMAAMGQPLQHHLAATLRRMVR